MKPRSKTSARPSRVKYRAKNIITGTGPRAFIIQDAGQVNVHFDRKRKPKVEYPDGSIGADLLRRNYIRYLTERYFRYREADASFGPKAVRRFSYAVLFKNVEARFKAPTYFIPATRFDELVDFLQDKIERTILGKRNRVRAHRNYESFDEFQLTQAGQ